MKLLKRLFVLFAVITITACSSDDDSGSGTIQYDLNNTNLSSGAFAFSFYALNGTATNLVDGSVITVSAVGEGFNTTFTFLEDGTYVMNGSHLEVTTVTDADGGIVTSTEIIESNSETGTYAVNGMQLVLDAGTEDEETLTVTLFNANEIRLTAEEISSEEDYDYALMLEFRMTR